MNNNVFTAKNTFSAGLIQDLAPDNTLATCMTNALNATLKTNNGNEYSLQNDMGNIKVETAKLPEGYVPVGTCEFGGIIYIASYNPDTQKSLLGCFPSPERLFKNTNNPDEVNTIYSDLYLFTNGTSTIFKSKQVSCLTNVKLHSGDEYKVEYISGNDDLTGLITNILGVLDSNNKFVPLKDLKFNEFSVYASPYVSELYLQSILNIATNFSIDYEFQIENNKVITIYPKFTLNDTYGHTYKVKIQNKLKAVNNTVTEYIVTNSSYEGNEPFYRGNDNNISVQFDLYVVLNENEYLISELTKEVTIDLSKVGTGTYEIKKWRHFDNGDSTIIDFLINAFPKPNLELSNLKLTFNEIYPNNVENSFILNYTSEQYNKSEYLIIDYNIDYNNSSMIGTLYKDKVYEVLFNGSDSTENVFINEKRILYTCPIFNEFWNKDMYQFLYESEEGTNLGLVQDYKNIPFKDKAGYVHGFKRNNKNINPLKIIIKPKIELLNVESTNYSENLSFTGDLIYDEIPSESIKAIFTTQDSLNAKVKIIPEIISEFGDTFFNNLEFTYSINDINSIKTNEQIDLNNLIYKYQQEAILLFEKILVNQYNYTPAITTVDDLEKYGINIIDIILPDGSISKGLNSNKETMCVIECDKHKNFYTHTINFTDTWRSPESYNKATVSANYLNIISLQDPILQGNLVDSKIFVPITIGKYDEYIPSFHINGEKNKKFLGPIYSEENELINVSIGTLLTSPHTLEIAIKSDDFWKRQINNWIYYNRVWWMLMLDEDGVYVPLNWFAYHRPYSMSAGTLNPKVQTIFYPSSNNTIGSTVLMQELGFLLASVYIPKEQFTQVQKVIPIDATLNSNIDTIINSTLNSKITSGIINNDLLKWEMISVDSQLIIDTNHSKNFKKELSNYLSNRTICSFDNTVINNLENKDLYGLNPTKLCYYDGIKYCNIDENLPFRKAMNIKVLENGELEFDFGNLSTSNNYINTNINKEQGIYLNNLSYKEEQVIGIPIANQDPVDATKTTILQNYEFELVIYDISQINSLSITITLYPYIECLVKNSEGTNHIYTSDSCNEDIYEFNQDVINKYINVKLIADGTELNYNTTLTIDNNLATELTYKLNNIELLDSCKKLQIKIIFNLKDKFLYNTCKVNGNWAHIKLTGNILLYVLFDLPKATIGKYLTHKDNTVLLSANAKNEVKDNYLYNSYNLPWYFNKDLVISPYTSL